MIGDNCKTEAGALPLLSVPTIGIYSAALQLIIHFQFAVQ